jgi:hypothetical protein
MFKEFLFASVVLVGMGQISAVCAADEGAFGFDQNDVPDTGMKVIEALIVQHQDDPNGLREAVEMLVVNDTNPASVADAVLLAVDHAHNLKILNILAQNTDLSAAVGQGLGAAIAVIGLTNPALAAQISAMVTANGSDLLVAAVGAGARTKTASILSWPYQKAQIRNWDSTPENPASAS